MKASLREPSRPRELPNVAVFAINVACPPVYLPLVVACETSLSSSVIAPLQMFLCLFSPARARDVYLHLKVTIIFGCAMSFSLLGRSSGSICHRLQFSILLLMIHACSAAHLCSQVSGEVCWKGISSTAVPQLRLEGPSMH